MLFLCFTNFFEDNYFTYQTVYLICIKSRFYRSLQSEQRSPDHPRADAYISSWFPGQHGQQWPPGRKFHSGTYCPRDKCVSAAIRRHSGSTYLLHQFSPVTFCKIWRSLVLPLVYIDQHGCAVRDGLCADFPISIDSDRHLFCFHQ